MGESGNFTSPSIGGSSDSIPSNQQQRVPNNTRSVPPAIAGKTSPKPSAAKPGLNSWHLLNSLSVICLLLFWGQSIKVLSQLLRKAKQKNLVIPNAKQAGSEQGTFEGATSTRIQSIVTSVNICALMFIIVAGGYLGFKTGWIGYKLPTG